MLAIRLQRNGRKGYAQYRVIVQDSRKSPKSGRVVANLGNFNPHTKEVTIDNEKASLYLQNGAQPSERVAAILSSNGVKMPAWVTVDKKQERGTKSPDKLRKNRPAEEVAPAAETPTEAAEESAPEQAATEAEASETPEKSAE